MYYYNEYEAKIFSLLGEIDFEITQEYINKSLFLFLFGGIIVAALLIFAVLRARKARGLGITAAALQIAWLYFEHSFVLSVFKAFEEVGGVVYRGSSYSDAQRAMENGLMEYYGRILAPFVLFSFFLTAASVLSIITCIKLLKNGRKGLIIPGMIMLCGVNPSAAILLFSDVINEQIVFTSNIICVGMVVLGAILVLLGVLTKKALNEDDEKQAIPDNMPQNNYQQQYSLANVQQFQGYCVQSQQYQQPQLGLYAQPERFQPQQNGAAQPQYQPQNNNVNGQMRQGYNQQPQLDFYAQLEQFQPQQNGAVQLQQSGNVNAQPQQGYNQQPQQYQSSSSEFYERMRRDKDKTYDAPPKLGKAIAANIICVMVVLFMLRGMKQHYTLDRFEELFGIGLVVVSHLAALVAVVMGIKSIIGFKETNKRGGAIAQLVLGINATFIAAIEYFGLLSVLSASSLLMTLIILVVGAFLVFYLIALL